MQVLVIDDEPQVGKLLQITLQTNQYTVQLAETAKEGLVVATKTPPDLILLDLGLPDEDGYSVLKKLRDWYTKPIIIISVQSSEEGIIHALDHGANDYIIKPFRTGELLARVRSAIKIYAAKEENNLLLDFNGLVIDLAHRTVKKNNEPVKLTATEYELLALFAKNEGKVLTQQYLLKEVWGPGFIKQSQYLRVFIAQLRKKIEDDPNRPVYIITEAGVGYRFVVNE